VCEGERRYREEDLLPLSGLQHMVFCDRQAALIHVDGVWVENSYTLEGRHLHRAVDEGGARVREGTRVVRGLPIVSYGLGLSGRSDVVELTPASASSGGIEIPGLSGSWELQPVEYKRGKPKDHHADEVQNCAQAICLEEHFGVSIPEGSLFYGTPRRRVAVVFDDDLRRLTAEVAEAFHDLVRNRRVPVRMREPKCERCSLQPLCLPPKGAGARSGRAFLERWIKREAGAAMRS
jgi:CRISPR-associated exonuclease Cas4